MSGLRLAAAIFNGDHLRLADELARLESAGLDALHVDLFDGRLVPDLAFPPATVARLRAATSLPVEVHLVAEAPERFAPELADAGVDLVLMQCEGAPMLHESLYAFRERDLRVGIAVGLATPLATVEAALPFVDAVLLLSRVTGEGARGATFDARVLPRVHALREADVELQVAGGVNRDNLPELAGAGAATAVLGAGLYRAEDLEREVGELRRLAQGAAA